MSILEQTVWSASSIVLAGGVASANNAASLLAGLMDRATEALDGDRERARAFIGRASALLEAAVEDKSFDDRSTVSTNRRPHREPAGDAPLPG